jgi:hypothetical protein
MCSFVDDGEKTSALIIYTIYTCIAYCNSTYCGSFFSGNTESELDVIDAIMVTMCACPMLLDFKHYLYINHVTDCHIYI